MKIIDKEGKLFGRVNIVDITIIVLVLAVAIGVGYKFFGQKDHYAGSNQKVTKDAEVTFNFKTIVAGSEEALQVGDKLFFENAMTDAEIVDVKIKDVPQTSLTGNSGVLVLDTSMYKQATVTVKMKVDVARGVASFHGENLKANNKFAFETATFMGEADIVKICYDK